MIRYQLVTGQKLFLPRYHCHSKELDLESKLGIFVGYRPTSYYLRAYVLLKKHMHSNLKSP